MPAQGANDRRARHACRGAFFVFRKGPIVKLILNGEGYETRAADSVAGLLAELGVPPRTVVVTLNDEPLAAASRGTRVLQEGDRVELFRFVGGG
jgi:thiazole synthase/sulfur carrier protein